MKLDVQNGILIVLVLALLLIVFSMSALALSDFVAPLELNTPVVIASNNTQLTLFSSGVGDVYFFGVNKALYLASSQTGSITVGQRVNGPPVTGNSFSILTQDSTHSLFYQHYTTISSSSSFNADTVPLFSSVDEALSALSDFIEGQNPPDPSFPINYSLPAGNVAYIKLPDSLQSPVEYSLSTIFPVLDLSSYSLNNQVSTVVSSIPSGQSTAPSSPTIPWSASGKVNLFGLSRNQSYSSQIPTTYGGYYLLVCNPLYYPVVPSGGGTGVIPPENGSINISVSSASSIVVFPLDSRLQFTGSGLVVDATSSGESYTGTVDSDTGSLVWTDPDGGDTPPVVGGNTQVDSVNDSIYDYLRNIVQSFSEFLRGPVDAVRTVVNAIRSFMGSFVQLYEWLPSPVYNLITSALMIALTIGVIKIFV